MRTQIVLFIAIVTLFCHKAYAGLFYTEWKSDTSYSIYGEMRIDSYRQKKRTKVPVWQERKVYYNSCGEKYLEDSKTLKRQFVPKVLKFDYQEYPTACKDSIRSTLKFLRFQNHVSFKYYSDSNLIATNLTGDSLKIQLYSSFNDTLHWMSIPPYEAQRVAGLVDLKHFDVAYLEVVKGDEVVGRTHFKNLFPPNKPIFPKNQKRQELLFNRDTISSWGNDSTTHYGEYWYVADSIKDFKEFQLIRNPHLHEARYTFYDDGTFVFEADRYRSGDYVWLMVGDYQTTNDFINLYNLDGYNDVWSVFKLDKINPDSMSLVQIKESFMGFKDDKSYNFEVIPIVEFSPQNDFYMFPKFTSLNKHVDSIINNRLTTGLLDNTFSTYQYSIFENVWEQGDLMPGSLFDIDYGITFSSENMFSMEMSAEGCGAYCEHFTLNYNFDLANGSNIALADIIEDSLRTSFLTVIKESRKNQIDSILIKLRSIDAKAIYDRGQLEYHTEQVTLYENCIKQDYWDDLKDINFGIYGNELIVTLGRCSAHYNRAMDEIGRFRIPFSFNNLPRFLSSYGKSLILK